MANPSINSKQSYNVIQLLGFGFMLAAFKFVYLFFDPYGILDVVVFLTAGIILGPRVPVNRKALGLLLSLPAFSLCLFFVWSVGLTSIRNGIGTAFAISLIVIPVATVVGVFIGARRVKEK